MPLLPIRNVYNSANCKNICFDFVLGSKLVELLEGISAPAGDGKMCDHEGGSTWELHVRKMGKVIFVIILGCEYRLKHYIDSAPNLHFTKRWWSPRQQDCEPIDFQEHLNNTDYFGFVLNGWQCKAYIKYEPLFILKYTIITCVQGFC